MLRALCRTAFFWRLGFTNDSPVPRRLLLCIRCYQWTPRTHALLFSFIFFSPGKTTTKTPPYKLWAVRERVVRRPGLLRPRTRRLRRARPRGHLPGNVQAPGENAVDDRSVVVFRLDGDGDLYSRHVRRGQLDQRRPHPGARRALGTHRAARGDVAYSEPASGAYGEAVGRAPPHARAGWRRQLFRCGVVPLVFFVVDWTGQSRSAADARAVEGYVQSGGRAEV